MGFHTLLPLERMRLLVAIDIAIILETREHAPSVLIERTSAVTFVTWRTLALRVRSTLGFPLDVDHSDAAVVLK